MADLQVDLNPDTLELTMTSKQPMPKVPAFRHIDTDLFGKAARETRFAGPLADAGGKSTWKLDPRSQQHSWPEGRWLHCCVRKIRLILVRVRPASNV